MIIIIKSRRIKIPSILKLQSSQYEKLCQFNSIFKIIKYKVFKAIQKKLDNFYFVHINTHYFKYPSSFLKNLEDLNFKLF